MNNTLPTISYSPSISNPKLNPNKPKHYYKIPTQGVDVVEKIGKVNHKETSAKMLLPLLKSGLFGEKINPKVFEGKSYNDWARMYNLAHANAIIPVALDGLKNNPEIKVPKEVLENMEINTETTKKYHNLQEKLLGEFSDFTKSKGIDTVQMKGVGYSMNYPDPLKRFGGDIDVFNIKHGMDPTLPESNMSHFVDDIAGKAGMKVELDHGPKHSSIRYKGMPFENHRNFLNVESSDIAKKMNKYLFEHINPQKQVLPNGTKILVPSKEFNNVFISFHALQHYSGGNVNFHHLTDWAVHVKKHGLHIPEEAKGTKLEAFMNAFTNLANEHLGTGVTAPKNEKLEKDIMRTIINPGTIEGLEPPKTKNPISIFAYRCKHYVAMHNRRAEILGNSKTLPEALFNSFVHKIKNPKTIKNLFKMVK